MCWRVSGGLNVHVEFGSILSHVGVNVPCTHGDIHGVQYVHTDIQTRINIIIYIYTHTSSMLDEDTALHHMPSSHFATEKAQLEYASLVFSADGLWLASLSGCPDFLLTVWYVRRRGYGRG